MINEAEIIYTLTKLDVLFNSTADNDLIKYYSKLSMLEFCGWIEITMDSMVLSFASRKLGTKNYKDECNKILKKTNGFLYDEHFRQMIYKIVGFHNLEIIETKIGATNINALTTELELLWQLRNDMAHTYTDSLKIYKTTPSTVLNGNLVKILPILKLIQAEIDAIV